MANLKKQKPILDISFIDSIPIEEYIKMEILPFKYLDWAKTRLPRKSSKGYDLKNDTNLYFKMALHNHNSTIDDHSKFDVTIRVICGRDKLGKADLDNYCKAILDGITNTKKIWKDDKQVDKIEIIRDYLECKQSSIHLSIKKMQNSNLAKLIST